MKRHIRADCWTSKKKQQEDTITELTAGDEDRCDILSVTDSSISNKMDGLLTLDVHSISVLIGRCSPHIFRFKGEWSS